MQSALYSRQELVTMPLGIDASIPALPLVRVHQLYSFEHFYKRGEKDMSNANSVHQKEIGLLSRQRCRVYSFIYLLVYYFSFIALTINRNGPKLLTTFCYFTSLIRLMFCFDHLLSCLYLPRPSSLYHFLVLKINPPRQK